MEKTATLNLRVNPTVKQRAEEVLKRLGIPMSTAIDMYLNQITLTRAGCRIGICKIWRESLNSIHGRE